MLESARGSLWTKTFHLDNIGLDTGDVRLKLLSPFCSAALKSAQDFKKDQNKSPTA